MQKLTKEQMLSELMVKLETIDGKLDKLLSLSEKPVPKILLNLEGGVEYLDKPTRWSNESYTDYLKRIGEYNLAQSDEEIFREECK